MSDDTCPGCANVQWLMRLGGASDAESQSELCVRHLKEALSDMRALLDDEMTRAGRFEERLAETSQRLEQAERVIAEYRAWDATVQELHTDSLTEALERYDTERAKFTSASAPKPAKL